MDRSEAIRILEEQQENDDKEGAHVKADDVLCELLKALGYEDVIEEYHKIWPKWYA